MRIQLMYADRLGRMISVEKRNFSHNLAILFAAVIQGADL
jgi:hypothetical protein